MVGWLEATAASDLGASLDLVAANLGEVLDVEAADEGLTSAEATLAVAGDHGPVVAPGGPALRQEPVDQALGGRKMSRHVSQLVFTVLVGFAALSVTGDELAAQQTTFNACRVPDVGAIYLIGVSGAPAQCLDPTHIQFSWTAGAAGGGSGSNTYFINRTCVQGTTRVCTTTESPELEGLWTLDGGDIVIPGTPGTLPLHDCATTASIRQDPLNPGPSAPIVHNYTGDLGVDFRYLDTGGDRYVYDNDGFSVVFVCPSNVVL